MARTLAVPALTLVAAPRTRGQVLARLLAAGRTLAVGPARGWEEGRTPGRERVPVRLAAARRTTMVMELVHPAMTVLGSDPCPAVARRTTTALAPPTGERLRAQRRQPVHPHAGRCWHRPGLEDREVGRHRTKVPQRSRDHPILRVGWSVARCVPRPPRRLRAERSCSFRRSRWERDVPLSGRTSRGSTNQRRSMPSRSR